MSSLPSTVPEPLLRFFHSHSRFLLVGHQEPDADCLGSQLALGAFLARLGKTVKLYNHGPFKRAEINRYQPLFRPRIDAFDKVDRPGVVVLDCSTLDRIGELKSDLEGLSVAVIDHHAVGEPFGDVRWIEPERASATWMVHRLIEAMGHVPTPEEAEFLFLGLATDTGFFRHCESGSQEVFETAAKLVRAGASPKATYQQINGGRFLANQKLMGLILSRVESHFDGKVLSSWEVAEDRDRFGAENRESDTIYQVLSSVSGCELVVLLRQDTATSCTGGLRSKAIVDVAQLARQFGGGGHVRASGFACPGRIEEIKQKILESVRPYFTP